MNLKEIYEKLKMLNAEDLDDKDNIITVKAIKKEATKLLNITKCKESKFEAEIIKHILNLKDPFARKDILKKYPNYPEGGITKVLTKLVRKNSINRIGWNLYSTNKTYNEPIVQLSNKMNNIKKILNENGVNFIITGLDILQEYVNLIPKQIPHLIYVVKGSGEFAKELIEKKITNMVILNPSKKEVKNMYAHYMEDVIIVREVGESSIEYHKEGVAIIEKAIVDLFFEITRNGLPFDISELSYILKNTLPQLKIDYKRLLRAASRRNIQSEFIKILNALNIRISGGKTKAFTNDAAEKVIRMLK